MTIIEKLASFPETPSWGSYLIDDVNLSLTFPTCNPSGGFRLGLKGA